MNETMTIEHDVADMGLAEAGRLRVEWAERFMPVLRQLRERFAAERPLEGVRVSACLHVTTETANLMLTLQEGGADVLLCASNPLSTQDPVAAYLVTRDIKTFAVKGEDNDRYYDHIRAALAHEPSITMDDGADLVGAIHMLALDRYDDLAPGIREWGTGLPAGQLDTILQNVVGSTEETTTGIIRLRAMAADGALRFPVMAVNDATPSTCSTTGTAPASPRWTAFSGPPTCFSPARPSSWRATAGAAAAWPHGREVPAPR